MYFACDYCDVHAYINILWNAFIRKYEVVITLLHHHYVFREKYIDAGHYALLFDNKQNSIKSLSVLRYWQLLGMGVAMRADEVLIKLHKHWFWYWCRVLGHMRYYANESWSIFYTVWPQRVITMFNNCMIWSIVKQIWEKSILTLYVPICFIVNTNIYLHFMSLLQIDITQVLKILSQVRPGATYST